VRRERAEAKPKSNGVCFEQEQKNKLQMTKFPEHLKYLPAYIIDVTRPVYMQLKSKIKPTQSQFYV